MNEKILIVDDEQDIITYLSSVLEENNFLPYSADNVEDGLQLLEQIKPDLVCLDIMMPKKSGISMYINMRNNEKFRQTPVLIISGVVQDGKFDFRQFIPDKKVSPPQQYLEKPINVNNFIKSVKQLIRNRSEKKGANVT